MRLFLLPIVLALCSSASAGISECMDATCRIEVRHDDGRLGVGTGCIFSADEKTAYVLTNAHVADGEGREVKCIFTSGGHEFQVNGRTHWSVLRPTPGEDVSALVRGWFPDAAIVEIDRRAFGNLMPTPIPIAADPSYLQANVEVLTVGCPEGSVPAALRGHVQEAHKSNVTFQPPTIGGQSGSAVFDKDGTQIVGLVAWNISEHRQRYDGQYDVVPVAGIAQRIEIVAQAFASGYPNERQAIPVCSGSGGGRVPVRGGMQGGGCPDGSCGNNGNHGGGMPSPGAGPVGSPNDPSRRVPLDELGPVAPLAPVTPSTVQPNPASPPLPPIEMNGVTPAELALLEARIMAAIAAIRPEPGPSGPAGPAGPQGPAGPAGNDGTNGTAGTAVEIDYDRLAEALARKNPSLTRDQVVAIVKEHCATKPDTDSTRPNPLPGYYEIRPKTKGAN